MKNTIIASVVSFVAGVLITFAGIYQAAPSLMLNEYETVYNFEESTQRFEKAVKDGGWKMSKIHDLQATMKKFDKDVRPVKVFEICHPDHAGKVLAASDERIVASLMPCRVSIYEKDDGKTYVSSMNTGMMGQMMDGIVPEVMADASKASAEFVSTITQK